MNPKKNGYQMQSGNLNGILEQKRALGKNEGKLNSKTE